MIWHVPRAGKDDEQWADASFEATEIPYERLPSSMRRGCKDRCRSTALCLTSQIHVSRMDTKRTAASKVGGCCSVLLAFSPFLSLSCLGLPALSFPPIFVVVPGSRSHLALLLLWKKLAPCRHEHPVCATGNGTPVGQHSLLRQPDVADPPTLMGRGSSELRQLQSQIMRIRLSKHSRATHTHRISKSFNFCTMSMSLFVSSCALDMYSLHLRVNAHIVGVFQQTCSIGDVSKNWVYQSPLTVSGAWGVREFPGTLNTTAFSAPISFGTTN